MAKKIKLSALKIKSSSVALDAQERKATKGGYFSAPGGKTLGGSTTKWIVDTGIDIRLAPTKFTSTDFRP